MEEEILKLETELAQAIMKNDAGAVGRFLADDWIIIDPRGELDLFGLDLSAFGMELKTNARIGGSRFGL